MYEIHIQYARSSMLRAWTSLAGLAHQLAAAFLLYGSYTAAIRKLYERFGSAGSSSWKQKQKQSQRAHTHTHTHTHTHAHMNMMHVSCVYINKSTWICTYDMYIYIYTYLHIYIWHAYIHGLHEYVYLYAGIYATSNEMWPLKLTPLEYANSCVS